MVPWLPFWITREWIYPSLRSTNATSVMYLAELKHFNSLQSAHWVDCSPRLRIIFACVRPGFSRKIAQIARMFHHFFLLIRNICIYIYIYIWHPFFPISKWICLSIYLCIYLSMWYIPPGRAKRPAPHLRSLELVTLDPFHRLADPWLSVGKSLIRGLAQISG